jgi:hypothetical protein
MPTVMLLLGGLLGTIIGALLGGGMAVAAALPLYGPIQSVVATILSFGPIASLFPHVITPIGLLFGAGLGFFVATIFVYLIGAIASPVVTGAALLEFFARGTLIGMSSMVNLMIMSALPWLVPFAVTIFIILMLSLIPAIAGNRFYERVIGALGWVLPLNYLMLPLGVALFILASPVALAMGGSVRFDFLTWSIETAGGAVLALASTSFNIGNFTFLPPGMVPSPSFTTSFSAHETGHTLGNAVFGGFFYWIGAIDENVPPLARGASAYAELFAESHFSTPGAATGVSGGPFIPMW